MSEFRLAIVDDDPTVRQMLPTYFEGTEFAVCACLESADELLSQLPVLGADIILCDARMPGIDGVALTADLRCRHPHLPVVGITSYSSEEYVVEMLRAGAAGMVLKSASRSDIIHAVREALEGRVVVSPVLAGKIGPYLVSARQVRRPELTPREGEVLGLLLDGLSNPAIAHSLGVSVPAVKKHVAALLGKYGVDSRLKLAVAALER